MRVYAAPHISEWDGFDTLSSVTHWGHYFDCLHHCSQNQPEHAAAVAAITDIMQQAHDIYLQQAIQSSSSLQSEESIEESICRLDRFKVTLESMPSGLSGTHTLVWATFLAAADSITEEHKSYFKTALLNHYSRSRFANLLRGVEYLPRIWAKRSEGVRWTEVLPEAGMLLV